MDATPKGYPFPVPADSNNVPEHIRLLALKNDERPGISTYTAAERDALVVADRWLGRTIWNSTAVRFEYWDGDSWEPVVPVAPKKVIPFEQTFTLQGDVSPASGDNFYIPPFFVRVPTEITRRIVGCEHRINSGTSATVTLQRRALDGTATALVSGLVVTPATTLTDFADLTLANRDRVELIVTAVSGTPRNLSLTVYGETVT